MSFWFLNCKIFNCFTFYSIFIYLLIFVTISKKHKENRNKIKVQYASIHIRRIYLWYILLDVSHFLLQCDLKQNVAIFMILVYYDTLIGIRSSEWARYSSVVRAFAHSVIDPSWWTHWAISCSSQCSTTVVTKAVVCVILSVGWCM